jgi:cardiolipin synthase
MTVANILTTIRLILTPVFAAFFIAGNHAWAILIFSVAGFTDLIDGTVARLLKQPSEKGALLDPLADKFLVQSCFVCLFATGIIPWWFFLLALARDLMIVGGIFYLEYKKFALPYRATWASKIATLLQLGVAVLGLLMWWQPNIAIGVASINDFYLGVLVATALLLFVSGAQYVVIGLGILKENRVKIEHAAGPSA